MNCPQTRGICQMSTIHLQIILCSIASHSANARTIQLPQNHEFWQSSITKPLICKMSREASRKPSSWNECYYPTISLSLTIGPFCFLFSTLDFHTSLLPAPANSLSSLKYIVYFLLCQAQLYAVERTRYHWNQRSPALGMEKSRRGENPCHGRQITATSMLDITDFPLRLLLFQKPDRNKEGRTDSFLNTVMVLATPVSGKSHVEYSESSYPTHCSAPAFLSLSPLSSKMGTGRWQHYVPALFWVLCIHIPHLHVTDKGKELAQSLPSRKLQKQNLNPSLIQRLLCLQHIEFSKETIWKIIWRIFLCT